MPIIVASFFLIYKQNRRKIFVITTTPTSILFSVNIGNTGVIYTVKTSE